MMNNKKPTTYEEIASSLPDPKTKPVDGIECLNCGEAIAPEAIQPPNCYWVKSICMSEFCDKCKHIFDNHQPTRSERMKVFLDDKETMIPILKDKIQEKRDEINKELQIQRENRELYDEKQLSKLNFDVANSLGQERVNDAQTEIQRYERYIKMANGVKDAVNNRFDIDQIKESVPIDEIIDAPFSSYGLRAKCICPLHEENTPSFMWYKHTNSWYCYGCGEGGSNIDLYMKMHNKSFIDSCKEMHNLCT